MKQISKLLLILFSIWSIPALANESNKCDLKNISKCILGDVYIEIVGEE